MEIESQEIVFKIVSGIYLGETVYSWFYLENDTWKQSYKWFNDLKDCLLDFAY